MLPFKREGEHGPLLVLLHWLGGGAQSWREVSLALAARDVRCVALDLPGFGEASSIGGYDIQSMTQAVVETIHELRHQSGAAPWFLAGHSMGGTVAAVVARRACDGDPGLEHLRGLILVAASPPGPEPISEGKRAELLASLGESSGDPKKDRQLAARFIDENTGKLPIPPEVRDRALDGMLGMNRTAFRAWLERGSKEDWRAHVGKLPLPALVFAGSEDDALGPDAQRKLTLPHLPQGELVVLEGAGHLAPLERPGETVEYLTQFIASTGVTLATTAARPDPAFEHLMHSDQTSPKTLERMELRLAHAQDWNHRPCVFSPAEFRDLRALAECIIPNAGFDLAACLDAQLAAQLAADSSDGWRFALLPKDPEAWCRGLHSLNIAAAHAHDVAFIALSPGRQAALLHQAASGKLGHGLLGALHLGEASHDFSAEEMQLWFEDVRSEFARLYMADPRTMSRIGYTGFADDLGFTQIQLGQQEEFER